MNVLFEYLELTGEWIPVPARAKRIRDNLWRIEPQFKLNSFVHDAFFDDKKVRINGVEVRMVLRTHVTRDPLSSNPLVVLVDVLK